MPLTHYLRLIALALLLPLLCSSISCFGNPWDPFELRDSGCGDPNFQLDCEPNGLYPLLLLNITGEELIQPATFLGKNKSHPIKIVNDKLWLDKCDHLGNYIQSWWYGSGHFSIADVYDNLTFWKDCEMTGENTVSLEFCGNVWYYSFDKKDWGEENSCKTRLQLPIEKEVLQSPYKFDNQFSLLQGFEIKWHDDRCGNCMNSSGICGYNDQTAFLCYCRDGTSYPDICPGNGSGRKKPAIIIGCSIGGVALTAIAIVLFLRFYAKKRKTPSRDLASGDMEAAVLHPHKTFNLPIFSYEELRQATNCFHEENEVGDGGFGSVYVGKIRDGRTVAVKRLYQDNSRRLQQFINEVEIFSTLKHPRVVRLYGCTSADSPELLLVYEFVANGTLADHLHGDRRGPRGLPWNTRLNIAIQTAEALDFLHNVDPPIFHRDVKSSNILLDENFDVKVADFGLCRLVPVNASHVTTAPQGTPGYVDPEYHQCYQLTEKSDVYSFGVVLVEIISAKLAVDINRNRREINLANMAKSKIQEGALHELVDPQLEIEVNHEVKVTVSAVAELAFRCLASERVDRPHMKEVVAQLEEIRQSWEASSGPGEQHSGSFSDIKQPSSPISVQDKWSSKSSTPIDTSA